MSRNIKNNSKKPYCKVCHDAGKPESEYTSHWVKDLTGKTTCPTLLDTECRYCYKLGHTAKFCDVLAKNNKEKEKAERRHQAVASKPALKQSHKSGLVEANGFAALCEDSDSEEEVSKNNTIVESFPVLGTASKKIEAEVKTGWAAIAAKPKAVEVPSQRQPTGGFVLSDYIKPVAKIEKKVESNPAPWAGKTAVLTKSWADWSDSEDEDEDEDEIPDFTLRRCEEMPRGWSTAVADDDDW